MHLPHALGGTLRDGFAEGGKNLGEREGLLTPLTGAATRDSPEHLQEYKGLGVHLAKRVNVERVGGVQRLGAQRAWRGNASEEGLGQKM